MNNCVQTSAISWPWNDIVQTLEVLLFCEKCCGTLPGCELCEYLTRSRPEGDSFRGGLDWILPHPLEPPVQQVNKTLSVRPSLPQKHCEMWLESLIWSIYLCRVFDDKTYFPWLKTDLSYFVVAHCVTWGCHTPSLLCRTTWWQKLTKKGCGLQGETTLWGHFSLFVLDSKLQMQLTCQKRVSWWCHETKIKQRTREWLIFFVCEDD